MRGNSTFSLGVLAAMLVCAAAFLGIGAPAASAAAEAGPGWTYQRALVGGFTGQVYEVPRTPVAVDGNGNVFAVNQDNSIKIFSPSGELLSEVGGNFRNIAIDQSDDSLYADELPLVGNTVVRRYTSDGQPAPTYTLDPSFEVPLGEGLAVDPTTNDLLIADPGAEGVRRYDITGSLLGTISTPGIAPAWIAAAPDGSFYVGPAEGPDVSHFGADGTLLGNIAGVGSLGGLAYDPTAGVLVADVEDKLRTYSSAGALRAESQAKGGAIGLAVDPISNLLYQHVGGRVNVYSAVTIPGIVGPVVSEIGPHTAHLEAEVDPGAGPPAGSEAFFEYSDDGLSWNATPKQVLTGATTIEADLTGLKPNLTYLVRVKALNEGTSETSEAISFDTPTIAPELEVVAATGVTETGAVLNGRINAAGLQTTYHFEYGTSTAYGSQAPAAGEAPVGSERQSRSVSKPISGLQPGTVYHYRLVATNSIGTSVSTDQTFTTRSPGETAGRRAYEQVTPIDKRGALIDSEWHSAAMPEGGGVVVAAASGSSDGATANVRQNYAIRRGENSWLDWEPTDAPQRVMPGIFEATTAAVSSDMEHALVISSRDLAPGGIEGGGNFYIKDLRTGDYTFVGGAPGAHSYTALAGPKAATKLFLAGAPDFSWVIFASFPPLLPSASDSGIYRWTESGGLSLESIKPGDVPASGVVVRSEAVPSMRATSEDGSVVYFNDTFFGQPGAIYRRENGETTLVSHADGSFLPESYEAFGVLDGVSRDGRYAIFHLKAEDPPRLTADTPAQGFGVYRYDSVTDTVQYLTSRASSSSPDILGVSEDADTVYVDQHGSGDPLGGPVLVWRNGLVKTVTTGSVAGPVAATSGSPIQSISPNGRYFVWMAADSTVHVYDADSDEAVCVSCPSDGGTPGASRSRWSEPTINNHGVQVVNDAGMVLFDSPDQLTIDDRNGSRDVYAYQDGELTLISPGNGDHDAQFVDASADGRDIYFQTDQGLVGQDVDGEVDVYDARLGGGLPSQNPTAVPQAPCGHSECAPVGGGSPALPTIGSSAAKGSDDAGAGIRKIKALSRSDRTKLAKGKMVRVKVTVSRPGTLTMSGGRVVPSAVKAARAGTVAVPVSLSRAALATLERKGSLVLRLEIGFDGEREKALSLTLRSAGPGKGGRS